MNIKEQKAWRRQRLAELLEEYGQAKLASETEIASAYLWQMAHGEGDSARNVSDEMVSKIEKAIKRPGYFIPPGVAAVVTSKAGKDTPGWLENLTDPQLLVSALVMDHLNELNDVQCAALVTVIESFVREGQKKRKAKAKA